MAYALVAASALAQLSMDLVSDPLARKVAWLAGVWLAVLALSWATTRFFDLVDDRLTAYGVPDRRLSKLDFLVHVFLVLMGAFATLFVLGIGEALWGAVAVTSVAGIIVGLAAQQLAKNLLAGIVILFERPFVVGDTIDIGGKMGEVAKVTLHTTTMRSPNGLRLTVPNSKVLDATVTNYSAIRERRIELTFDVRETWALDDVARVLREAAASEEHLRAGRPITVFPQESLDDGTRFVVRYWVDRVHYADHCLPTALTRLVNALRDAGLDTSMRSQRIFVEEGAPAPTTPQAPQAPQDPEGPSTPPGAEEAEGP